MRVIFVHNNEDIGETELESIPQNADLVYLERYDEHVRYIVLNRIWVFDKSSYPYVKVELAKK